MLDNYGREWRFSVDENTGTITRGRLYQCGTSDDWAHYWDGSDTLAFYDEGYRGVRAIDGLDADDEWLARAIYAHDAVQGDQSGASASTTGHRLWRRYDALDRVAVRYTGNLDARFLSVPLDRGTVFYMMLWSGGDDADLCREVRDEVNAVWNNDIWRIEVEEYAPGLGYEGGDWVSADDVSEQWYGEDKGREAWGQHFPLDEFPADLLVGSDQ